MSLKDTEMQVYSLLGAALLSGALIVPFLLLTEAAQAQDTPLKEREVIEATLAYRKKPQKQPQKKRDVVQEVKPQGVSRDENKKVEEKKEEKKEDKDKKPVIDPKDPFKGIRADHRAWRRLQRQREGVRPREQGRPVLRRVARRHEYTVQPTVESTELSYRLHSPRA